MERSMPKDTQFLKNLVGVRPGLTVAALRSIVGAQWREPLPHEEGKVLCIAHSHGFTAQIDNAGIVGRVEFGTIWNNPAFALHVDIGGLHCGMSIKEARSARPDLTISPGTHPMPTFGS